jgi:4-cresol dehydrogenase (hydroxylating)
MTRKDWLWKIKNLQTLCALMQGVPTDKFIPSAYWRKQVLPQQLSDPDPDGCGLIWHSVVAPMTGDYARALERICREVMHSHGFDPVMTMSLLSERSLTNVISISYDREVAGEDARAMACHRALEKSLADAGFYPYRLGVQSMTSYASTHGCHDRLVDEINRAVDPNHILSFGRYQPNENSIKDASSW